MKKHILALSTLSLGFLLGACSKSDSSDEAPAPVASTVNQPGADAGAAATGTPDTGATPVTDSTTPVVETTPPLVETPAGVLEDAIKLNSTFLEYSLLQYDCGDIAAPQDAAKVEASLKGLKKFESLAATIPAKDQALVKISTEENGVSCTYRAVFSVNKSFTQVTYVSSQALNADSVTACASSKAVIDLGFGTEPVAFDYDKKFIRWVALHIPETMQATPVCATGKNLRAVFSGAVL